jgi:hypothetical protein
MAWTVGFTPKIKFAVSYKPQRTATGLLAEIASFREEFINFLAKNFAFVPKKPKRPFF